MFDKEQNLDELNMIMGVLVDKRVISNANEATNNAQLVEEMHQQMKPIKLECLHAIPLEQDRRKLNKKYRELVAKSELHEISKKLNIKEFESNLNNNVISKPGEFHESSRRNTYFMKLGYVPA